MFIAVIEKQLQKNVAKSYLFPFYTNLRVPDSISKKAQIKILWDIMGERICCKNDMLI